MKFALFAIVAACVVAASIAAPVPNAVDWKQVAEKVGKIEQDITNAVREVKSIAAKDNAQVGAEVAKKLDAAAVKAKAVLEAAAKAIADQSLTQAQAQKHFDDLKAILAQLQSDLQSELSQLSAAAANEIRAVFNTALENVTKTAREVLDLLAQLVPTAVDWKQVAEKVGKIEQDITSAVREVKSIANNDNAQVGAEVSKKLDAAAVKAKAVLEAAAKAIADQSLTQAQAQKHFDDLKAILAQLQSDLQSELSQLSAAAATQIRGVFNTALENVTKTAREVLDLLAQLAPQAVDWKQVAEKVGKIEQDITTAVREVKSIAAKDNAQVGAEVAKKLDAAAVKAKAVLEAAAKAIADQSLTQAQAQKHFDDLKAILAQLQSDLQSELSQLSAAAANEIRAVFNTALENVTKTAREVLDLLAQFLPAAVDWKLVAEKVGIIEQDITNAVREVKSIAAKDNAQVGAEVAKKLDAAAVKAKAVLEAAAKAIADQSLTQAQAQKHFDDLKAILAQLQSDLQSELSQLSAAAANEIRAVFNTALENVTKTAREVLDLLAQLAPQAVDWKQVADKVGKIEQDITNAVREVKTIANNDNAQVGAEVSKKLDAAAVKAKAVLEAASKAIADQSLTQAQAQKHFDDLKAVLAQLQNDLQSELSQLSSAAANQIRAVFNTALENVTKTAREVLELLAQ